MNNEDTLLTPLSSSITGYSNSSVELFITYLSRIEGWKTKTKNLHWASYKMNIHKELDNFLEDLEGFQDSIAEGYMGILGRMQANAIKPIMCECMNALDLLKEVRSYTTIFYTKIPQDPIYKGLTSECETFIQKLNVYNYLFSLCDI